MLGLFNKVCNFFKQHLGCQKISQNKKNPLLWLVSCCAVFRLVLKLSARYRLLGEETPGGPSEGGAGGVPGHGGAVHPAVQQHAEKVRGAGVQHLLHPGHAQQALQLGVVSGEHHQGRHLPS